MLILIYKISTILLMLLGLAHAFLTSVFYSEFSADAVWFAGTGLSLLFLGTLNFAAILSSSRKVLNLCIVANAIGTILGVLILIVVPEIQASVALIVFLAVLMSSIFIRDQFSEVLS